MKLEIKSIELKGFKPYKNTKAMRFDGNALIEGDNGQGKSSIADAICFAFLGTGADGVEKAGSKLLNNESKDMYVTLIFEVDGEEHILTRAKKSSKSELILDTNSIEQVELMNWIKQKDLFLSIFNPAYFTGLQPKEQKEILQKYLGEVKFDEVIEAMGAEGQRLVDDCFMVPQIYLDRKREELKEADSRENYLKGFIDGKELAEVPEPKVFTEQKIIDTLQNKLYELNAKPTQLHDISGQINTQNELNKQLNELNGQKYKLESGNTVFEEESQIASKKAERESLLSQHGYLKRQLDGIKLITCPNCGTEIEAVAGMKEQITKQMDEIIAQGRSNAVCICELQDALDKKKVEREEEVKHNLETINRKISELQQHIQVNDISKLQAENEKYTYDLQAEKSNIQQQIQDLNNKRREVEVFNQNRQQLIEQNEKNAKAVEDAKAELSTFEPLRTKLNQDIERAKKFNATKLRMQGEYIGQFLDKVNIQFQKIVKSTGEVKDDFKLQYEDKDFNLLSTSERIKAGLEISNLLMNATGCIYPVFIDNAESITAIPQLETQTIVAKVKEGEVLR